MKRVLLIGDEINHVANLKWLLMQSGYYVEHCEDLRMGINRNALFRKTPGVFDLSIICCQSGSMALLEKISYQTFFNKLILFHLQQRCDKKYCQQNNCIHLCNPGALMHCVRLLEEDRTDNELMVQCNELKD